MQIYITDSDYEVMKQLEALINGYPKHTAKCYTTHRQLLDAVRSAAPDIALVDVDEPSGTAAVRRIRTESPGTKVILLSGNREMAAECFRCNANGFLVKPVEEEKLKEQLCRARQPLLARIRYGRPEGAEGNAAGD